MDSVVQQLISKFDIVKSIINTIDNTYKCNLKSEFETLELNSLLILFLFQKFNIIKIVPTTTPIIKINISVKT